MKLTSQEKSKLNIALVMIVLAVIVLITGTYAWFSLSLNGKVNTMDLEVTAGDYLRIDVSDRGNDIKNWTKSVVDGADVERQLGFQLTQFQITPVTSGNGTRFYSKSDKLIESTKKMYMQFDLYFISNKDVSVYLTEENSTDGNDGTKITSKTGNSVKQEQIVNCVRVSFAEGTSTSGKIYEPSGVSSTPLMGSAATDGGSSQSTFAGGKVGQASSKLFDLKANVSKKIVVRVWIEGQDKECTSDVELSKFSTRLRFEGEVTQ